MNAFPSDFWVRQVGGCDRRRKRCSKQTAPRKQFQNIGSSTAMMWLQGPKRESHAEASYIFSLPPRMKWTYWSLIKTIFWLPNPINTIQSSTGKRMIPWSIVEATYLPGTKMEVDNPLLVKEMVTFMLVTASVFPYRIQTISGKNCAVDVQTGTSCFGTIWACQN